MTRSSATIDPIESVPSVLLLFGEEDLLVEETAWKIWNRCITEDPSGLNSDLLDGEGLTTDVLASIARSFPMMGNHRVIWVRHAEKLSVSRSKGTDPLEQYLADPMPSTTLLLTASFPSLHGIGALRQKNASSAKKKISALKNPVRMLLEHAHWIEYPTLSQSSIVSWLIDRARGHGLSLSAAAAEFFVARGTGSLREAALEFDKLQTYLGDRTTVTEEDVLAVVGGHRVYNSFELQKAFGQRDVPRMITIISKMLESDRQELLMLTMLTRYVTALYRMVEARQLGDRAAIAQAAGVPPFLVGEYMDAVDRLGPAAIDRAIHELRFAERTIKSTSTDSLLVLERMIARIFAP